MKNIVVGTRVNADGVVTSNIAPVITYTNEKGAGSFVDLKKSIQVDGEYPVGSFVRMAVEVA
jgi:hypothetical protein